MGLLSFLHDYKRKPSPMYNLWTEEDINKVPTTPGAYILLAEPRTKFLYPNGNSPVFYIGQAINLRNRLSQHRSYSSAAKSIRKIPRYYPRYEYAAVFGCRFVFIRTWQGLTAKGLEEKILASFSKQFHSWPVANGAGSWNRID